MAVSLSQPEVLVNTTELHSAARTVPQGFTEADVTLTSPSGEWDSKAGTGNLTWGIEVSYDGSTWTRLIFQTLPIGSHSKAGGMPALGISRNDLAPGATASIRLFASSTTPVRVGALITAA